MKPSAFLWQHRLLNFRPRRSLGGADPAQRDRWLEQMYSDTNLAV